MTQARCGCRAFSPVNDGIEYYTITELEEIEDFPDHVLDRPKNHPGDKLRVGDVRVLIDWDKDTETMYGFDAFGRKTEYRELGQYREVWGSWRDED